MLLEAVHGPLQVEAEGADQAGRQAVAARFEQGVEVAGQVHQGGESLPGVESALLLEGALLSCVILTTEANEVVRPVHDRMPVIVPEECYDLWIDRSVQDVAALAPVLLPYPAEALRAFAVGLTVNDPQNEGPACLAPPE